MCQECVNQEEISKMEERLIKMEHEIQVRYCQMGKSLLELAGDEQKSINNLVDEIISIRKQLALAKHDVQCPRCMAYNTCDSKFCKRCGAMLNAADDTEED